MHTDSITNPDLYLKNRKQNPEYNQPEDNIYQNIIIILNLSDFFN
jgi:hypothetical protein